MQNNIATIKKQIAGIVKAKDEKIADLTAKVALLLEAKSDEKVIVNIPSEVKSETADALLTAINDLIVADKEQTGAITSLVEEIKAIEYPNEVAVKNLSDITEDVQVKNWPNEMKVKVTNLPPEKDNTSSLAKAFKDAASKIIDPLIKLFEGGISLKYDKKTPLFVMPVDEKGNVLRQKDIQVFGGGGGSSSDVKELLFEKNCAQRIYTADGYTYIAKANPGATTDKPVWKIKRVDSVGNITWANGDSGRSNVADDYATINYL